MVDTRTESMTQTEWRERVRCALDALTPPGSLRAENPKTTPPARQAIAGADIKYLSSLIKALNDLYVPHGQGAESARPTPQAYNVTSDVLVDAGIIARLNGSELPAGVVALYEFGGVRIEWQLPRARITFTASQDGSAIVSVERGGETKRLEATPEALFRLLDSGRGLPLARVQADLERYAKTLGINLEELVSTASVHFETDRRALDVVPFDDADAISLADDRNECLPDLD